MTELKEISTDKTSKVPEGILNQEKAAKEGFKNCSKVWYDTTLSFQQGMELLQKGKDETEDIQFPIEDTSISTKDDKISFKIDDRDFVPTEHALRQVCTKFGIPAKIVTNWVEGDSDDVSLVADILNNGKRHYMEESKTEDDEEDKKNWLFRTRTDGTLRAALSTKYLCFNNLWYLESLAKIIPSGRLSHWKPDGIDTLYGNILIPDSIRKETDSEYGGGLSVGNSEIGVRSLSSLPWLYVHICQNGCIWSKIEGVSYNKVHLGKKLDLEKEFGKLTESINKQIPLIPTHIDTLLNTKKLIWNEDIRPLIAQVSIDNGLSKKESSLILEAYEFDPNKSAFGILNALTRASQRMSSDVWVSMDSYAGNFLTDSNKSWERLKSKAKTLNVKEVNAKFINAI